MGIVARYMATRCAWCWRPKKCRGLCNVHDLRRRAGWRPMLDGRGPPPPVVAEPSEHELAAAEESGRVPAGLRAWIMRPDPLGLLAVAERRDERRAA